MYAIFGRQQMRHRFLGRSLSHRARDPDGGLPPYLSHRRSQRLQRNQRVIDGKQTRGFRIARQLILLHDRRNRAPSQCLLYKVVPVQPFALDGKKNFARLHRPRIDRISLRRRLAIVLPAGLQEFADA